MYIHVHVRTFTKGECFLENIIVLIIVLVIPSVHVHVNVHNLSSLASKTNAFELHISNIQRVTCTNSSSNIPSSSHKPKLRPINYRLSQYSPAIHIYSDLDIINHLTPCLPLHVYTYTYVYMWLYIPLLSE